LKWLKENKFQYLHHRGAHAIYQYKTGHISIPDHPHLKPGLLSKLKNLIIGAFKEEGHRSLHKKTP
jgi:predicted RNA binding protein YcfA (HicA-like mRNA interferase family)